MSDYYLTLGNRGGCQLGKICPICDGVFKIYDPNDHRILCPECFHRLKNLLYPEVSNDD